MKIAQMPEQADQPLVHAVTHTASASLATPTAACLFPFRT